MFMLMFVLVIAFTTGCEKKDTMPKDENQTENEESSEETGQLGYKSGTNLAGNYRRGNFVMNNNVKQMQIARQVKDMPQVDDAVCLLNNNNEVVVGVDCKNTPKGVVPADVKNRIIQSVKMANPNIKNVVVTSDEQLFGKLNSLSDQFKKNTTQIKMDFDNLFNNMEKTVK